MTFNYDAYAQKYDNEKDFDRYLLEYKFRSLKNFKENLGVTLELGCANGLMTERVLPLVTSLDVVDASEDYLIYVEEKMKRVVGERAVKARYHHSFFEKFVPEVKYDTILLAGVLPALSDQVGFLRQIAEWLAPGGFIFITSHNGQSLHRRIGKIMGLVKEETELSKRDTELFNHHKVYTHESMRQDVMDAGLVVLQQEGVFLKPFPNDKMAELSEAMIEAFYEVGKTMDATFLAEITLCAGHKK